MSKSIIDDRSGWDFFHLAGPGEHIEREDDDKLFEDEDQAVIHVLFRTLAQLEQTTTACLEIGTDDRDSDLYRNDSVVFARRVLAAVGRTNPGMAKLASMASFENNDFLGRLIKNPKWVEEESLEIEQAMVGGSDPPYSEEEGTDDEEAGSHAPDCPYRQKGECDCWRSDPDQNPEARDADGA